MSKPEIQVSPEEYRFLRGFFRRQAMPWMMGMALVAVVAARWAVPAADPGIAPRLDEAMAKLATLEMQNAELRTQLEAMGQRMPTGLDRRIADAEGRITAMERRPGQRDSGDVAQRVAQLEARVASTVSASDTVARSNLARLRDLESRLEVLEGPMGAVPAAPAP